LSAIVVAAATVTPGKRFFRLAMSNLMFYFSRGRLMPLLNDIFFFFLMFDRLLAIIY